MMLADYSQSRCNQPDSTRFNMQFKSILSCSTGNILEWYDFGLFAIFSPLFSQLFFPASNPHTALLETFSVFAIGFFCRPIGALLFGYLGDRHGRGKTLRFSILMISLPTLLIGFIPVYTSIGIAAPLLLILTRMWQGISLGGEFSGTIIYLGESATATNRSFYTSLAASGANIGILLAILIGFITSASMSNSIFINGGWRIPYLLSGILCLIIYVARLKMEETPAFIKLKTSNSLSKNPINTAFKYNFYAMLRIAGLLCMGSTFYYFIFLYLPISLQQNSQLTFSLTTQHEYFFMAAMVILVPFAGWLNDKLDRYKMLVFNAILISVIIIPGYYFLQNNSSNVTLFILALFTLASSLEQGTTPAVLVENFPVAVRYTGISFAYNIVNGFLGGSIPLICIGLVHKTHFHLAPAFYVLFYAIITLLFAVALYKRLLFSRQNVNEYNLTAE